MEELSGASKPLLMLLDGSYSHSMRIAGELKRCMDIKILGVGAKYSDCLLRSDYVDYRDIVASGIDYAEGLFELYRKHLPDFILPVGTPSVIALDRIRDAVPPTVFVLPPSDVLDTCLDKASVLKVAGGIGVSTPVDYTAAFLGTNRGGGRIYR